MKGSSVALMVTGLVVPLIFMGGCGQIDDLNKQLAEANAKAAAALKAQEEWQRQSEKWQAEFNNLNSQIGKLGVNMVNAADSVDPLAIKEIYRDQKDLVQVNIALEKQITDLQKAQISSPYQLYLYTDSPDQQFEAWVDVRGKQTVLKAKSFFLQTPEEKALNPVGRTEYTLTQSISANDLSPGLHHLFVEWIPRPGATGQAYIQLLDSHDGTKVIRHIALKHGTNGPFLFRLIRQCK